MNAPINWFEIPTTDLARATRFYEVVLGHTLRKESGAMPMSIFPYTMGYPSGALVADGRRKPSDAHGTLVYFGVAETPGGLEGAVIRAVESGGTVLLPKTDIGPNGFIAVLKDTEGNAIGLHAEP